MKWSVEETMASGVAATHGFQQIRKAIIARQRERNCELLAETAPENQRLLRDRRIEKLRERRNLIKLMRCGDEVSFVVFVDQLWVDDDRIDEFVMIDFNACSYPFSLS